MYSKSFINKHRRRNTELFSANVYEININTFALYDEIFRKTAWFINRVMLSFYVLNYFHSYYIGVFLSILVIYYYMNCSRNLILS